MSGSNGFAVSCSGVQKHYGEGNTRVDALRGVDFTARFGELSFLVGPSGCGKTTLLCVISGLLDRSAGDLAVLGQKVDDLSGKDRVLFRRKNLGFVFQQYNLLPALTAAENVAVPLLAAGVARPEAFDRAKGLLSQLGLENRVDAQPSKLSGGQQQRVALARALIHEPKARRVRRADGGPRPRDGRDGHGAARFESRAAGPSGHRRDPRLASVPPRAQHRPHGRREHRGGHPPERFLSFAGGLT